MRSALASILGLTVTTVLTSVLVVSAACSSDPAANRFHNGLNGTAGLGGSAGDTSTGGSTPDVIGGAQDAGFNPDAACGAESFTAKTDPVRIYLVVDRSGSMDEKVGGKQKLAALRSALVDLVAQIGFRAQIALAVYPYQPQTNACRAGHEMFAMQDGDARSYYDAGNKGPVATHVQNILTLEPSGGTPTGPTLVALRPTITALGKNTFVLLATDGGPNCNDDVSCAADQCIPNIENEEGCSGSVNCCDPAQNPQFTGANCIDANATLTAVSQLAAAGVKTLVLGIPGSAPYKSLLESMAVAGGAPRDADPRYYAADSLDELSSLLSEIGSQVLVSCNLTLEKEPEHPDLVNLYFDNTLQKSSPTNGWTWTGPTTIELHGAACDKVLSGDVGQVNILLGCPTEATQ